MIEFYEIINFFNVRVKRRLKCPYKHTKKPKMDNGLLLYYLKAVEISIFWCLKIVKVKIYLFIEYSREKFSLQIM